eukprot:scaffold196297_cov15-Tisochrysis_lutea.AAC.2
MSDTPLSDHWSTQGQSTWLPGGLWNQKHLHSLDMQLLLRIFCHWAIKRIAFLDRNFDVCDL